MEHTAGCLECGKRTAQLLLTAQQREAISRRHHLKFILGHYGSGKVKYSLSQRCYHGHELFCFFGKPSNVSHFQTTVASAISTQEMVKFGKTQKFYICLCKNSNGQGLREWVEKEDNVTFLNRNECCERFNLVDGDNNIEMIQKIISEVPAHSVVVFDEVPLTSKVENRTASYDWSSLENKRPEEVTAVVCLQPIRIAPTFRAKAHTVIGPKDADVIELFNQYRSSKNILGFVNQLCQEKLPIEYANVKAVASHDVQGPGVTAISIVDQSQAEDLRIWLCNHLQQELACKPSQVKMIHLSSTKKLAQAAVARTVYENSVIQIDEFQGCETYVGVVFLGMDNNYSQLLEMCSRAQYKLILVINRENTLLEEISAQTEITVLNIGKQRQEGFHEGIIVIIIVIRSS